MRDVIGEQRLSFLETSIGRRLLRGSLWSFADGVGTKLLALVQSIALARLLGISGFGEWGLLLSTSVTITVFASFGLATTATKHVAQWRQTEPERLQRLLGLLQILSWVSALLTCAILVVGADLIADHLLLSPRLSSSVAMVGVIVFGSALSTVYAGVLRGMECFAEIAVLNSLTAAATLACTVCLAAFFGLDGAILGLLAITLLNTAAFAWRVSHLLKREGLRPLFSHCLREWDSIRDTALPTVSAGILAMVAIWIAQLSLARQPTGYEQMGAYHAANQWRTMLSFLPNQILAPYLPVLSSLLTTEPAKARSLQNRTLAAILLVTSLSVLPVALAAPWLMRLYGDQFVPFWPIIVVVASISIFDLGHLVLLNVAIARGYAWRQLFCNIPMFIVIVLGAYLVVPKYYALGLVSTLLAGYAIRFLVEYVIYRARL